MCPLAGQLLRLPHSYSTPVAGIPRPPTSTPHKPPNHQSSEPARPDQPIPHSPAGPRYRFGRTWPEDAVLVGLFRVANLGHLRRNQQFTGEQKRKGKIGTDRLIPRGRVCRIVPNPARSKENVMMPCFRRDSNSYIYLWVGVISRIRPYRHCQNYSRLNGGSQDLRRFSGHFVRVWNRLGFAGVLFSLSIT